MTVDTHGQSTASKIPSQSPDFTREGSMRGVTIGLDFDGTLYPHPFVAADDFTARPTDTAIAKLHEWVTAGAEVWIHTCRFTANHEGATPGFAKSLPAVTDGMRDWLTRWWGATVAAPIKFWIYSGKPYCDVYLDDKALHFDGTWPTLAPENLSREMQEAQRAIAHECDALKSLLLAKNLEYGNSALNPLRVFSRASTDEQIRVRLDDKLSRLANGVAAGLPTEDTEQDLLGYLILLRVHRAQANAAR